MDRRVLRETLKLGWQLLSDAIDGFSEDRGDMLAAALAFYTLLSLAPLVIVAVAIAGVVLGTDAARAEVSTILRQSMGQRAAETVLGWVDDAAQSGGVASAVGGLLTLFTASRLFAQLQSALNQVWGLDVYLTAGFRATVQSYVRRRLFAFAMVLAAGPLLLVAFVSRALLSGLSEKLFGDASWSGALVQSSELAFSFATVAVLSALTFKIVPDTRVGWRAVWFGGIITSGLFTIGNALVGLYLGRASVAATYGAAGSLVVVLLWLYFSAQILLFGAELTQCYGERFGWGLTTEEQREMVVAEQEAERRATDDAEHPEHAPHHRKKRLPVERRGGPAAPSGFRADGEYPNGP